MKGAINYYERVAEVKNKKPSTAAANLSFFVSCVGNFSVQYNLQSASIAIPFMLSAADIVVTKSNGLIPDFVEPTWASNGLKGAVFAGAFVGMISMGYLGDLLGRRIGMMTTLAIVVLSAAMTAYAPFLSSPWLFLIVFRFLLGMGVGGIYPMAAVTAAEANGAAKTAKEEEAGLVRAGMGFFFQTVGGTVPYVLAYLLLANKPMPSSTLTATQAAVLMGSGVVPAAIVLFATYFTQRAAAPSFDRAIGNLAAEKQSIIKTIREHPEYLTTLIGTGGSWFLYDVSFYGINIFTPEILKSIFGAEDLSALCWQTIVVFAVGLPACALAIVCLKRWGGNNLMFYGFITNALAFFTLGIVYYLYPDPTTTGAAPVKPYLKFTIFCAAMFSLNWGPNLATYVVPLSAFPIEVRGTFHGLSAASGKAGAALGAFLYPIIIYQLGPKTGPQTIFFIQVGVNGLGALLAWRFLTTTVRAQTIEEIHDELLA